MVGPLRVVGPEKAFCRHRSFRKLIGRISMRGEGDHPALTYRARARAIHQDSKQPRFERRPTLESVNAMNHTKPGVLHDFFGDGVALRVHERQPEQWALVALDQLDERHLVAPFDGFDEGRLIWMELLNCQASAQCNAEGTPRTTAADDSERRYRRRSSCILSIQLDFHTLRTRHLLIATSSCSPPRHLVCWDTGSSFYCSCGAGSNSSNAKQRPFNHWSNTARFSHGCIRSWGFAAPPR